MSFWDSKEKIGMISVLHTQNLGATDGSQCSEEVPWLPRPRERRYLQQLLGGGRPPQSAREESWATQDPQKSSDYQQSF